jgi:undecaprenyl-diphosphatase
MSLVTILILAIIQGLAEFLPISSSGHLRGISELFSIQEPQTFFDIVLHVGTLVAIVLFYRHLIKRLLLGSFVAFKAFLKHRDVKRFWSEGPEIRMLAALFVSCIPTGIIGVLFGNFFENALGRSPYTPIMLIINGFLLFSTRFFPKSTRDEKDITLTDGFFIGLAQGVGILRGISRSGITISMGLGRRLKSDVAAAFSFLMSIPAILGALIFKWNSRMALSGTDALTFIIGAVISGAIGYAALTCLKNVMERNKLHLFAYYCWGIGSAWLVFWLMV